MKRLRRANAGATLIVFALAATPLNVQQPNAVPSSNPTDAAAQPLPIEEIFVTA
jgi:hypothetical protein